MNKKPEIKNMFSVLNPLKSIHTLNKPPFMTSKIAKILEEYRIRVLFLIMFFWGDMTDKEKKESLDFFICNCSIEKKMNKVAENALCVLYNSHKTQKELSEDMRPFRLVWAALRSIDIILYIYKSNKFLTNGKDELISAMYVLSFLPSCQEASQIVEITTANIQKKEYQTMEKTIKKYMAARKKGAANRANKYTPFKNHFKEKQKEAFIKNPNLTANAFAHAFFNNPTMEIPYKKQNQLRQLIRLAEENNRYFKTSLLAKGDNC